MHLKLDASQQNSDKKGRVLQRFDGVRFTVSQVHHASRTEYLRSSVGLEFHCTFQALDRDRPGCLVFGFRFAGREHQPEDLEVIRPDQGF